MTRAVLAWAAVIVPVWVVLILCTHWEPVVGDGWGHVEFHHENPSLTAGNVWEFAKYNYLEMNPRLGQTVTMLLYSSGPWHPIATPIVELALLFGLCTLALGRWPSLQRADDALAFATVFAMIAWCAPVFGQMLFYRPYTGNYLYGLALCTWLVVPYRLHAEAPRDWGWWWSAPLLFVLGAAAGFSNEHTGPAIAAIAAIAIVCFWRRGERPRVWMIAGLVGVIAGGLALYYAPGQALRYNELAAQDTLLGRIAHRGISGNLKPFGWVALHLTPLLVWVGIALAARRGRPETLPRVRAISAIVGGAAAILVVATLLASPKQGERLELAAIALACAAFASWLLVQLTRGAKLAAWALAAGWIVYFAIRCVPAYATVGREFRSRLEAIEHAKPGTTLEVQPYSVRKSHWFYGDDFLLRDVRARVAEQYGLAAIELASSSD